MSRDDYERGYAQAEKDSALTVEAALKRAERLEVLVLELGGILRRSFVCAAEDLEEALDLYKG